MDGYSPAKSNQLAPVLPPETQKQEFLMSFFWVSEQLEGFG
jgi:hypothetical protein